MLLALMTKFCLIQHGKARGTQSCTPILSRQFIKEEILGDNSGIIFSMVEVRVICTPDDFLLSYSRQQPKMYNFANIFCKFASVLYIKDELFVCLCRGITAQSTQWGHAEHGQLGIPNHILLGMLSPLSG